MKTSHLVTASVLSMSWLLANPAQAQVTSGQIYRVASACDNNKVMFIKGGSTADLAAVVLDTRNDQKRAQTFKIESANGAYKFIAQHSGKAVDVPRSSKTAGTALIQYTYKGSSNQLFRIVSAGSGYYKIQNVNSNLYVDIKGSNMNYGTPFLQWSGHNGCNQRFKFIATGSSAPAPSPSPQPAPAPAPSPSPAPSPAPGGSYSPTNPGPAPANRDPYFQPFASNSAWNMPIGSGAKYVAINLPAVPHGGNEWSPMPQLDLDIIVLKPTAPLVKIYYSDAGWTKGKDRCRPTGSKILASVPMPTNYIVPHSMKNYGAAFLMSDRRTIAQTQPLARCSSGGNATSLVRFKDVDLYADGHEGAHGGSRLSAIGGTIRIGELRPGKPVRHAVKFTLDTRYVLADCTTRTNLKDPGICHRWPAFTSDSMALSYYGSKNPKAYKGMKMGALLAIPPSVDINKMGLESVPGKMLAWTLQNYGGYIVDGTGGPGYDIAAEVGPDGSKNDEFRKDFGYPMEGRIRDNTPWTRDFQRLMQKLHLVDNNGPNSIGGGGTPRQPLAPAIRP